MQWMEVVLHCPSIFSLLMFKVDSDRFHLQVLRQCQKQAVQLSSVNMIIFLILVDQCGPDLTLYI